MTQSDEVAPTVAGRPARVARHVPVPPVALAAYAASRVVVALAQLVASHLPAANSLATGPLAERWDGFWFTYVAAHGYPRDLLTPGLSGFHGHYSEWAFLPGYPLLLRAVHTAGVSYDAAALGANAVLGAVLAVTAWHLFAAVGGPAVADRASWLFWFFPGSVVASLGYSEPLFLVCASVCLLALLRCRWEMAGVAALVGGASRATGVALVLACAVAAWPAVRQRQWRALVAPALAPLGMLAFAAYGWHRTGRPFIWHDAETLWHQGFDLGAGLPHMVAQAFTGSETSADSETFVLLCLVFLAGVGLVVLRGQRLPAALSTYLVVALVLSLGDSHVGARPRFVWAMLPVFILLARGTATRWWTALLTAVATLLPLATVTYLVSGHGAP